MPPYLRAAICLAVIGAILIGPLSCCYLNYAAGLRIAHWLPPQYEMIPALNGSLEVTPPIALGGSRDQKAPLRVDYSKMLANLPIAYLNSLQNEDADHVDSEIGWADFQSNWPNHEDSLDLLRRMATSSWQLQSFPEWLASHASGNREWEASRVLSCCIVRLSSSKRFHGRAAEFQVASLTAMSAGMRWGGAVAALERRTSEALSFTLLQRILTEGVAQRADLRAIMDALDTLAVARPTALAVMQVEGITTVKEVLKRWRQGKYSRGAHASHYFAPNACVANLLAGWSRVLAITPSALGALASEDAFRDAFPEACALPWGERTPGECQGVLDVIALGDTCFTLASLAVGISVFQCDEGRDPDSIGELFLKYPNMLALRDGRGTDIEWELGLLRAGKERIYRDIGNKESDIHIREAYKSWADQLLWAVPLRGQKR
jgi:hypothetical protein